MAAAQEEVPVRSHTRERKVAPRPPGFVDPTDKSISFAMSQHDKNGHTVLVTKQVPQPKRAAATADPGASCEVCGSSADEARMLLCDGCDRGAWPLTPAPCWWQFTLAL